MVDNPEVIRQQMEETRSHLADKLEALESQVTETVQSTTEAVASTVEAVKETVENVTSTVQDTVHSVGETFDIRLQAERHPWIVFGGSVAVGCVVGNLVSRLPSPSGSLGGSSWSNFAQPLESGSSTWERPAEPAVSTPQHNGRKTWFSEELDRVKGLALGAIMGVVRDMVAKGLPGGLGERVAEEIDHLNTRLGGEKIQGPLVPGQ